MQTRLVSSIVVAVLLVGAAFWFRFAASRTPTGGLSLTDSPAGLNDYVPTSMDSVIASGDSTNKTSLMGQQLLTDFISLSANGQNSGSDISNLTDQYVSNIAGLLKSEVIQKNLLNVVGSSKSEVSVYSEALQSILNQYEIDLKKAAPTTTKMNSQFYAAARNMSVIYSNTASKLKTLAIPLPLADLHLKLINVYLSDAAAMTAIANTETDPAKSFSGLVTIKNNLDIRTS